MGSTAGKEKRLKEAVAERVRQREADSESQASGVELNPLDPAFRESSSSLNLGLSQENVGVRRNSGTTLSSIGSTQSRTSTLISIGATHVTSAYLSTGTFSLDSAATNSASHHGNESSLRLISGTKGRPIVVILVSSNEYFDTAYSPYELVKGTYLQHKHYLVQPDGTESLHNTKKLTGWRIRYVEQWRDSLQYDTLISALRAHEEYDALHSPKTSFREKVALRFMSLRDMTKRRKLAQQEEEERERGQASLVASYTTNVFSSAIRRLEDRQIVVNSATILRMGSAGVAKRQTTMATRKHRNSLAISRVATAAKMEQQELAERPTAVPPDEDDMIEQEMRRRTIGNNDLSDVQAAFGVGDETQDVEIYFSDSDEEDSARRDSEWMYQLDNLNQQYQNRKKRKDKGSKEAGKHELDDDYRAAAEYEALAM